MAGKIIKIIQSLVLAAPWMVMAANQPIRILTEHLPPYQIANGTEVSGFATDVVRKTFAGAGIPYEIEVHSWSRAYQLA